MNQIDENCSICFDNLQDTQISKLTCDHTFHKECINNYIKNNMVNNNEVSLCPIDHLPWTPKQKEVIIVKPEYYIY